MIYDSKKRNIAKLTAHIVSIALAAALVAVLTCESFAQKSPVHRLTHKQSKPLEAGPSIAMLVDKLPQFDTTLAKKISKYLKQQKLRVIDLTAEQVSSPEILCRKNFHTLILPLSRVYPDAGYQTLMQYIAKGGNVIALGAPALEIPLKKVKNKWIEMPRKRDLQPIEFLTPTAKFYKVTTARRTKISDKQSIISPTKLPKIGAGLKSVHARPQGTGYNKKRNWRWIPLIESFDSSGLVCGTPACMVINRTGKFKNAIITSFTLPDKAYKDPSILKMISRLAKRMRDGFFLFEGGAEYYAYFKDDKEVILGARTISTTEKKDPQSSVRITVKSAKGIAFKKTVPIVDGNARCQWNPDGFKYSTYQVTCELLDSKGKRIDILKHPLVISQPPEKPSYVTMKDGHFIRNGKRWMVHGINYMPSSGIAFHRSWSYTSLEDREYWELWMGKKSYDPVVIERDLQRIVDLGFNSVSIFCYHNSLKSRNLLDILERCQRHGLMVNLSLRPGTPLEFKWRKIRSLIKKFRLKEYDIIFAYDLAWEPTFGEYKVRKKWDSKWEKWIIERYGSIAQAEKSWGFKVPRIEGKVTGPSDHQITLGGDYRVMVCAYRRFLDDMLSKHHATARRLVRTIDTNHLISFRMRSAGDPDLRPERIDYDFKGVARSCDIMEPEAYGRLGDWNRIKRGKFTVDYARAMAPRKPVIWAEFGSSSWDREKMQPDPDLEKWVGEFYNLFFRMAYESYVDGTICWFYPGGFRVDEKADFGIINPDGSFRPVTHVIKKWRSKMLEIRDPGPVDEWISFNRDATIRGVTGVYRLIANKYWSAKESGRRPGFRQDGYGLDSATVPPVAVGNVAYIPHSTPHKYLNAEFDSIEIKNADGEWQKVTDGRTVAVKKDGPVMVRALIGNNGIAKWLSARGKGQVVLNCGKANKPIDHDLEYLGTLRMKEFELFKLKETMDVVFQMSAGSKIPFGEKVEVVLEVQ